VSTATGRASGPEAHRLGSAGQDHDVLRENRAVALDLFRQTTDDLLHAPARRGELVTDELEAGSRIETAAGEQVDRRVTAFGPGVDRQMRLGDDQRPAHAAGREPVERLADDARADALRRGEQDSSQVLGVVEENRIAGVVFRNELPTESTHQDE